MTFVVGMECCDGLVICTDSLEDDGITKKRVDKISVAGPNTDWSLAISGSGPSATIEKFVASLRVKLPNIPFDKATIENCIENELAEFNSKYVLSADDRFYVVIGLASKLGVHRQLYKGSCFGSGQGVVLTPILGECHTGMGHELWRLLSDALYHRRNSVEDNIRLGIFATSLAIRYASGVDEPVQVLFCRFGKEYWTGYLPQDIQAIREQVSLRTLKECLQRFWRINNPPTMGEQVRHFGAVRTPGDELTILRGVKLEELYTVAGRRRSSKIFRRNTDKLQQRAMLEAKRYQEAHPSASQSSVGKHRT